MSMRQRRPKLSPTMSMCETCEETFSVQEEGNGNDKLLRLECPSCKDLREKAKTHRRSSLWRFIFRFKKQVLPSSSRGSSHSDQSQNQKKSQDQLFDDRSQTQTRDVNAARDDDRLQAREREISATLELKPSAKNSLLGAFRPKSAVVGS
mmetsp:Transcript_43866/g.71332  ORF Transcript_43866/g.71332 Transcript_43866/m.71332 type:complete len:150 (+) Transcript_43866:204-653(+)